MKKKIYSTLIAWFLVGCMGWLSVPAMAEGGDPVGMLQSLADQMLQGLRTNKTSLKQNPSYVYSLARKVVVPKADLTEMSRRVLPAKIWTQASSSQKAAFEKEFTTLLVRTYASALADYTDQTVSFYPIRGGVDGKTNLKVDSQIVRTDGPSIPVSYRLINTGSGWKLYDMVVEGVSLLESFRSQFSDKLSRGNMDSLIKDMAEHNAGNIRRDEQQ